MYVGQSVQSSPWNSNRTVSKLIVDTLFTRPKATWYSFLASCHVLLAWWTSVKCEAWCFTEQDAIFLLTQRALCNIAPLGASTPVVQRWHLNPRLILIYMILYWAWRICRHIMHSIFSPNASRIANDWNSQQNFPRCQNRYFTTGIRSPPGVTGGEGHSQVKICTCILLQILFQIKMNETMNKNEIFVPFFLSPQKQHKLLGIEHRHFFCSLYIREAALHFWVWVHPKASVGLPLGRAKFHWSV